MDKQILKAVMLDNQREVQRYEVFKRNISFENFGNYVLVGIRRAGKSFLLYQRIQQLLKEGIGWDSMLYINFEDERLDGLQVTDLNLIIEAHLEMYGKKPILFLDEIQNIENWEKFARRLADSKYTVYITGSNAKMLSSDIQTTLGGRYITINVYPYSFKEFLEVHHTAFDELSLLGTETKAAVINRFIDYFHNGGFPEGALLAAKRNYLTSVYQKIYLGDIAARNGISNTFGLKIMIKKLAESIKQPVSFNRIANIVSTTGSKLSTTSAIKYIEYAESAWLLQRISNIAAKLAEKESNGKYYFTDNGILNLFLIDGNTSLLENLIATNLIRQFGKEDAVFFYNKDIEVDFYIPEKQWAIQVSYSIKDTETKEREVKALVKLSKVLPCEHLFIITFDEETILQTDGDITIEVVPAWKWLLKDF